MEDHLKEAVLEDLKQQSGGICIVVNSREESNRLNISIAEYTRAIRELNASGALKILIEPMESFYIQVNLLP